MATETQAANNPGPLAPWLYKPEVKGAWFNGRDVKLDGFRFVGCRFDNCKLTISSTNFEIENCYIDGTSQVVYSGEIVKPIRLFNSRYDWVYEHAPFFAPTKDPDGAITIKG